RSDEIWQVSGAKSTLLGETSEITTAMDATAMQQMLDALFQKQEVNIMQKQEESLQKLEENRQTDLQKSEENRAADQERFSEALLLIEQRQDAVENLLRNGGDQQNNSLHNASVSRMAQRNGRDGVSSDEEGDRQSRKDQNGQNFKNANDSLRKGQTRKQSTSQDARRSTSVKYVDNGITKSGRVFRNSALDHSPEIQPILKRPPISTNQH
ncbi:MAG: DUF4175 domain-containing protein, partial [Gammaproteobacteria bacterium]|nr:DUF4175 domain-containing protein [Gammaproteobacteria bacterium]